MDKPANDQETRLPDGQARLTEARAALEGEEWQKKRAAKEEQLQKRRRAARLAMESEVQRKKREEKEQQARGAEEAAQQAEATAAQKKAESEEAAAATAAAEEKRRTTAEAAFQARISHIDESGKLISELAGETGAELSPIRTLKTDMAKAVKEGGLSAARIAMSEQAKRAGQIVVSAAHRLRKTVALVFVILILLAAAAGGLLYFIQPELLKNWLPFLWPAPGAGTPTKPVPLGQPLIFSEKFEAVVVDLNTGKETLLQKISQAAEANLLPRTVKHIYLTDGERLLPFGYLRQKLALNLPGDLNRALKDQFMLGVFANAAGEKRRFFILTSTFFERAYGGLLQWEKNMLTDLGPLLLSTTTPAVLPGQPFVDKVVKNKDTRLLKDAAGNTVLFYAFLDNAHFVITTADDAFSEILTRFIAS